MSYFHKSEQCISPAINPPADCRNQSLAGRAEPRGNEAVVGHPALLDVLKALEQEPHGQCHGMFCLQETRDRERAAMGSWKDLGQEQPVLQTGIKEGKRWGSDSVILCSEGKDRDN